MINTQRDELIVIPESSGGGFICPVCLSTALGAKWAKHANYCPDCGQRIKIDSVKFTSMKNVVKDLDKDLKDKCCKYYSIIAPEGKLERTISGIYLKRFNDITMGEQQIEGQMNITDFI